MQHCLSLLRALLILSLHCHFAIASRIIRLMAPPSEGTEVLVAELRWLFPESSGPFGIATGSWSHHFLLKFCEHNRQLTDEHLCIYGRNLTNIPELERRFIVAADCRFTQSNLNISSQDEAICTSDNLHSFAFELYSLEEAARRPHFAISEYSGTLHTDAAAHDDNIPGLHFCIREDGFHFSNLSFSIVAVESRFAMTSISSCLSVEDLFYVHKRLQILPSSSSTHCSFIQPVISISRHLRASDAGEHVLKLRAYIPGHSDTTQFDETTVRISIQRPSLDYSRAGSDVELTHSQLSQAFSDIAVGATIFEARAISRANLPIAYRLEADESLLLPTSKDPNAMKPFCPQLLFDVDALTGAVFATAPVPPGEYRFRVVAQTEHEASLSLALQVKGSVSDTENRTKLRSRKCASSSAPKDKCFAPAFSSQRRERRAKRLALSRRDARSTFVMTLREDTKNGSLHDRVPLGPNELVKNAPVDSQYVTIYENGTMELVRPLNFEVERDVRFSVVVENSHTQEVSGQLIILNVTDVDERPKFINEPIPYQAVVPTEVPIGYTVYKFQARDEDGDGDRDVRYILINSQPEGMFSIDETGRVKTTRSQYSEREEYKVYVQAIDATPESAEEQKSKSEVAVLSVVGGRRAPQFLLQQYAVEVPENHPIDASVVHIQAQSFMNSPMTPVRYKMYDDRSRQHSLTFAINEESGIVRVLQSLDADDVNQPRSYNLVVEAVEGDMRSSVPLSIKVRDENDNAPTFTQPLYTKTIPEDFPLGSTILTASAKDKDEGWNAQVFYSVDNRNFSINDRGEISAIVRLDADQLKQGFFVYKFGVVARDRGNPSLSGSAQVQIRTENVNDEAPRFNLKMMTEYVAEDARGETPILTVEAVDPDRDQVKYMFLSSNNMLTNHESYFEIDEDTGLIKLSANVGERDLPKRNMFNLTVLASDDGSCCAQSQARHTSTATVIIGVKDVNNNKPVFPDCESYSAKAKVPEGKHRERSIINVYAKDEDSGQNGAIEYSLYYAKGETRKPFVIRPDTGELMASPYVEFDREERPVEEVTVKAQDKGSRPLIGFCHFTVTVLDENDNSPEFERAEYETTISRHTSVGKSVLTVFADDRDGPENANIKYSLREDDDAEQKSDVRYVSIKDSGDIVLTNSIYAQMTSLKFLVVANDSGVPPRETAVRVTLNIAEAPQQYPVWQETLECSAERTLDEDIPLNSIVAKCLALPGNGMMNGRIQYSLSNGAKPDTNANGDFRIFHEKDGPKDYAVVRNMKNLDYEKVKKYSLTLTAQDLQSGLSREKKLTINLRDKNDNIPRFGVDKFTAFIEEELEPNPFQGKPLATVVATDADTEEMFRKITYYILEGPSASAFVINHSTGEVWAKQKFDREQTDQLILDIEAEDSAKSDLPGATGSNRDITKLQVQIHDINDNHPYFDETMYRGRIKENAEVGTSVLTVKAHDKDKDSELKYSLDAEGNAGSAFGVRASSGTIYVNDPLDYETRKVYNLKIWTNDGRHRAATMVEIRVEDVNDNAPEFSQRTYVREIFEENYDKRPLPQSILKVSAVDRDDDSSSQRIVYKLEGQGANNEFNINERTGEIFVRKPLNRDPPDGVEKWNFIVQAIDDDGRGLSGYADVQVTLKDVNDEAPTFVGGPFRGFVDENQDPGASGVFVMQMTAVDNDDQLTDNARVTYEIQRNKYLDGQPLFRIEPNTGKIFALRKLDRENPSQKSFEIEVKATDHGQPSLQGTGTATIIVRDRNDNAPYFDPMTYSASVKETAAIGYPVLTVSAKDEDTEAFDNMLNYKLLYAETAAAQFFYVSTDPDSSGSRVGVVRVAKPLDFEDPSQRAGFNLTIEVFDGKFLATAPIHISLLDVNDNAPTFLDFVRKHSLRENVALGTEIVRALAIDADHDHQDTFEFSINKTSDPKRRFSIGPKDGILRVERPLDREERELYVLRIEAQDDAGNVGFTSISIVIDDVNDNAPILVPQRDPVVMENTPPEVPIAIVFATDPDTAANGPPFRFAGPQDQVLAKKFRIRYDSSLDNNRGGFEIYSKVSFDRETQKSYDVPIWVEDSGTPKKTAVRYLKVTIGDENDNRMKSASKSIHVYNYKGMLSRSPIGRVHVEDPDDWDIADKTFSWKNGQKPNFFDLDQTSGMLYIEDRVPEGRHQVEVKVFDTRWNEHAVGTVTVDVEYLTEEAFANSGSIRVKGMSAEDFIRKDQSGTSAYDRFRAKLADYLKLPVLNVQIFSVMPVQDASKEPMIDVRFAAHGSPYLQATALNGQVELHWQDLQTALGKSVQIVQVGINECLDETCPVGCTTRAFAYENGTVINANATAFVGVTTATKAECQCAAAFVSPSCTRSSCKNNGVCHNTGSGIFCECRNGELKGAQCEGTTRSFGGKGYVWLPPIQQCESFRVSFQFITAELDGNALLLFNGQMQRLGQQSSDNINQQADFIAVLLSGGRPMVKARFGAVLTTVEFGKRAPANSGLAPLNDGEWHQLDVAVNRQEIELVVDKCRRAKTNRAYDAEVPIISSCRASARIPGSGELLTVTSPLQLGGLAQSRDVTYPTEVAALPSFVGCMRDVRVQGALQDLFEVAENGTTFGCAQTERSCYTNELSYAYCLHGECFANLAGTSKRCECEPGYHGARCDKANARIGFGAKSFLKYHFDNRDRRRNVANVKILFTPVKDGTLARATDSKFTEFMSLQVEDNKVRYEYDMGSGQKSLAIGSVRLLPNQSYWLQLDRFNEYSRLSLDGLPGLFQAELLDLRNDYQIDLDAGKFFLGADSERVIEDFEGCVSDFRWDDLQLPLARDDESATAYARILSSAGIQNFCPAAPTCAQRSSVCGAPFVCADFWKGAFCTCPWGTQPLLSDSGTLISCRHEAEALTIGITYGAVAAILVSLIMLIILVLLLAAYTRRRRPTVYLAQEYDVRERIVNYLEEGGGEEDQHAYDISRLRKPVLPMEGDSPVRKPPLPPHPPGITNGGPKNGHIKTQENGEVADFIVDRLIEADMDPGAPPYDELRQFLYEGGDGLSANGSLSSLASVNDFDHDWDQTLSAWGPRFNRLAHMYSAPDDR